VLVCESCFASQRQVFHPEGRNGQPKTLRLPRTCKGRFLFGVAPQVQKATASTGNEKPLSQAGTTM